MRSRWSRRVLVVVLAGVLAGVLALRVWPSARDDPRSGSGLPHRPRAVAVVGRPAELAYVDRGGGVTVLHPDGTRTRWLSPGVLGGPRCGTTWCGGFEDLAWSPDGTTLALVHVRPDRTGAARGVVYLAVPGDAVPRRLVACPDSSCDRVHASGLVWAPDGSRLAVAGNGRIWVASARPGGSFRRFAGCPGCGARTPAWSPDGHTIAYVTNAGIFETDVRTRARHQRSNQVPGSIAWSPDGTELLLSGLGLYVLDLNHPGPLRAATSREDQGGGAADAAWSPDGTRVVWLATPGANSRNGTRAEIGITHLPTRSSRAVVDHHCCVATWSAPRWSPDGTRIAWVESTFRRPGPKVWLYVSTPDGGGERRYPAADGAGPPAWRP